MGNACTASIRIASFHVIYNPLLAFAVYLIFHEAIWGEACRNSVLRVFLFLLGGLMTVSMFITEGRTGQAVFLVLMGLLLLQLFANNRALFAFNGSWCVNVYKGMNPDLEYGAMLPPR